MERETLEQRIKGVEDKIKKAQERINYFNTFSEENYIRKTAKGLYDSFKYLNEECPFKVSEIKTMDDLYKVHLDLTIDFWSNLLNNRI